MIARLVASTALVAVLVAVPLAVPAQAETSVGVTAAVNPTASGTVGSNVRTLSLGDNVIYNERIQTSAEGLVQILLADGTTFMVGPNSDLVIDSFVYDPAAGTAQVTASFTKGVLRFIGGQTSKTDGGVTLNTPVGTMGIRGAMVDVVLDPPPGTPQHIDMLFGNEVTLSQGQDLLGRLYASGYSLVLGEGGLFEVMKTPPGFGAQIQQALSGKPGTTGGAARGPSNDDVDNSEVAGNNRAGNNAGLSERELAALLQAAAEYDQLRDFILNNQGVQGLMGGILRLEGEGTWRYPATSDQHPLTGEPNYLTVAFDAEGNPVSIRVPYGDLSACAEGENCVVYEGGTTDGIITATLNGELQEATTTSYLYDHEDVPDQQLAEQLVEELNCMDCESLVRWGFWGFETDNGVDVGGETVDAGMDGLWVTGNLTTAAQLQGLAEIGENSNIDAYYSGDAVANVRNSGSDYVATGDLWMSWNFANRNGTIYIDNFDAENAYSPINLSGNLGAVGETGFGADLYLSEDHVGVAQGAFVNGTETAGGVIGDFGFALGPNYMASGIFFGAQQTPE